MSTRIASLVANRYFFRWNNIGLVPLWPQPFQLLLGFTDGIQVCWFWWLKLQALGRFDGDGIEGALHLTRLRFGLDVVGWDLMAAEQRNAFSVAVCGRGRLAQLSCAFTDFTDAH